MTYLDLIRDADRQLDDGRITIGEYEQMIEPMNREIHPEIFMPSAQPETAKRIVGKSRDGMTLWYQCDMCNEPVNVQDSFCRGCGRRLVNE